MIEAALAIAEGEVGLRRSQGEGTATCSVGPTSGFAARPAHVPVPGVLAATSCLTARRRLCTSRSRWARRTRMSPFSVLCASRWGNAPLSHMPRYYSASVGEEMGPNRCYKVEDGTGSLWHRCIRRLLAASTGRNARLPSAEESSPACTTARA